VAAPTPGEARSGETAPAHPTGRTEAQGAAPDARGRATGRRTAEAPLDHFPERGATEVRTLVDTEQMGDVAGFFESLGFEPAPLAPLVRQL
jgi:GNAT superfamily N-acetyltransferase